MITRPQCWGVYLKWPEPGTAWIHIEDVLLAEKLIPSRRVFSRRDWNAEFNLLTYGRFSLRVRPTLWLQTYEPIFQLGDFVEIKSDFGRLDPQVCSVRNVFWNPTLREIEYELMRTGRRLPQMYLGNDLQPVAALGSCLPVRHLRRGQKLAF